ncbi:MAG: hypothetical protein AAFW95_07745, partial [Cyanobacteria bacterium J06638_6]
SIGCKIKHFSGDNRRTLPIVTGSTSRQKTSLTLGKPSVHGTATILVICLHPHPNSCLNSATPDCLVRFPRAIADFAVREG